MTERASGKAANTPTGVVTFLFTDIEGSAKLWDRYPNRMPGVLERHNDILRSAVEDQEGYVFKTVGDAFCATFSRPREALRAALAAQRALFAERWGKPIRSLKVRMALHTGYAELERDGDYFGPAVNRVARLMSLAHGEQVLLSGTTHDQVRDHPEIVDERARLVELGEHRLKDLIHPERVFQLAVPDLPERFPPLREEVPEEEERYRIKSFLGSGGFARVYLAHDEVLDLDVAYKMLHPWHVDEEAFVELFKREARSAAKLRSHPNVVSVFDRGEQEDGTYYMVMEYLPGGSLKDLIVREGPLPARGALEITLQIADALSEAHERGVIHRDIKSENILLTRRGDAKVTDFGIAKAADASITLSKGAILGSVHYISPEQLGGEKATARSDLYALGVVLYEMLTGKLPFDGKTSSEIQNKHLHEPARPLEEVNAGVPERVEAVTMRLLAKDPNERYPDADALMEELKRVLRSLEEEENGRKRPDPGGAADEAERPPKIVEIPDLAGQDIFLASETLSGSGLTLGAQKGISNETIAEGEVIRQSPAAGTEVEVGSLVSVTVSTGPKKASTAPTEASTAPTGTTTFLFTEVEGSTALWETYPVQMEAALKRHDDILRQTVEAHKGCHVFEMVGDACRAVFDHSRDALRAALVAQRDLFTEQWPENVEVRVRMGLHTGVPEERDGNYFGPPVSRVARLMSAGHGGQVLLSEATYNLVRDALAHMEPEAELRYLGEHSLKDLKHTERIYQLVVPDLPKDFPPLKALRHVDTKLEPVDLDRRYSLKGFIGSDADVYLAHYEALDKDVALKVLRRPYTDDKQFVERFKRKVKNMVKLSHPNIVAVHDAGEGVLEGREVLYIVMEYISGGTLRKLILQQNGPLPLRMAIELTIRVARALDVVHRGGVTHRDIKPENVLLTESGEAKVAGFGIAVEADQETSSTAIGGLVGTPHYMSPEQAEGEPASPRSDLYSLGVVLYEMLTGEVPYDAENPFEILMKHVNEHLRFPKEVNPDVPEGVNAIAVQLLAKNPEERYPDADALIEDLEQVLRSLEEPARGMLFLEHHGVTDPGKVRKNNEDSFLAGEGRDETLFVVADGMSASEAGELASSIAIDVLKDLEASDLLEDAIREANRRILATRGDERFTNMGTTVVAMRFGGTLREPRAEIAHVGDSRAYLLRKGELKPVTDDHSLVAELVRSGDLTQAQASKHPRKNLITRALGADKEVKVDTLVLPVGAGDRLLLCSDGLSDMVPEARMLELLTSSEAPEKTAHALVSAALEAGGLDNVTVVVVDVKEEDSPAEELYRGDTREMGTVVNVKEDSPDPGEDRPSGARSTTERQAGVIPYVIEQSGRWRFAALEG